MGNNRQSQPLGLRELNHPSPGILSAVLTAIACAGFGATGTLGFGDLLNQLIAQGNQGSSSAAASQTATYAGTATAGDVLTLVLDGVTYNWTVVDGTSVTTAMTEMKNGLNAIAAFAAAYTASNVAGVLTVTAKRKGAGFNTKTFAASKVGTGTFTAGAATFAGGTGVDDILSPV